jgi:purine-cytosine permease-like protein
MKLLDFVALYGLLLMPMGAVIFADFYFSKKMGFQSEAALNSKSDFSIPALLSWVLTLLFCLGLNFFYGVEIFFLGLPGWFVAIAIFIVLSRIKYPLAKSTPLG